MIVFPDDLQLRKAIAMRHSVRRFTTQAIAHDVADCINAEIARINAEAGLSFRMVIQEDKAFRNIWAYGKFENAVNYVIVSGPVGHESTKCCGYHGERIVLALQALGLNTCWVGLAYRPVGKAFDVPDGHKVRCVIAFGYGVTQGACRRSKTIEQVSNATPRSPQWFIDGVNAALLAPTAINQQKFYFCLRGNATVEARHKFSAVGYSRIDLGIAICHFNLASSPNHIIQL